MRLILKEYLSSLKERNELDAVIPDLLRSIGFNVFSTPMIGTSQAGVDIGAYGTMDSDEDCVYLFSIKAGDLNRSDWDGNSHQALRPSLNQIRDSYIPHRLPSRYKDRKINICITMGGNIQETIQSEVKGYIDENRIANKLEYQIWNGDYIASLILKYLMREELFSGKARSFLRKSIALIENAEISYKHFQELIKHIIGCAESKSNKKKLQALRQLHICLWILYSWCRNEKNIESAYLASEFVLMNSIEFYKKIKNTKSNKELSQLLSIFNLYKTICLDLSENIIIPNSYSMHKISRSIFSSSDVDLNFRLFDYLGRLSVSGILLYHELIVTKDKGHIDFLNKKLEQYFSSIKALVINNPLLFTPYKDDQSIDIAITSFFLALDTDNDKFLFDYFQQIINNVMWNYTRNMKYPIMENSYLKHLDHPKSNDLKFKEKATESNVLFSTLAFLASKLNFEDIYIQLKEIQREYYKHSNYQYWFPDSDTEEFFYTNKKPHGAILTSIEIKDKSNDFQEVLLKENDTMKYVEQMSCFKMYLWPLIFTGCRKYRYPIPIFFLEQIKREKGT